MSTINNMLFNVQNMAPALLGVGSKAASQTQNYTNLTTMTTLLGSSQASNNLLSYLSGETNSSSYASGSSDTVTLTYKTVGQNIVSDLASVTAETINSYPELDGDYVIALVDSAEGREARVYRRSEILENFKGSEEEKTALAQQLATDPLMVFANDKGLPPTASDSASQALASKINSFLNAKSNTLDLLDSAGYDPLADMLGSSTLKKILAEYAFSLLNTEEDNSSETVLEDEPEKNSAEETTEA